MAQGLERIEQIFTKADFSKGTDLQDRLWAQIEKRATVRPTNLNELMKEEGMSMGGSEKKQSSRRAENTRMRERSNSNTPDVLERDNPYVKKSRKMAL
ncbi:MAG: hypothetical protein J6P05_01935 [Lachnospiraceae bacterium]|nr:hypothetical protein [Lachnospiraceae bacterium]